MLGKCFKLIIYLSQSPPSVFSLFLHFGRLRQSGPLESHCYPACNGKKMDYGKQRTEDLNISVSKSYRLVKIIEQSQNSKFTRNRDIIPLKMAQKL